MNEGLHHHDVPATVNARFVPFMLDMLRRRGSGTFDDLVDEALEHYFRHELLEQYGDAVAAFGTLSEERGDEMLAHVRELRETWRDRYDE